MSRELLRKLRLQSFRGYEFALGMAFAVFLVLLRDAFYGSSKDSKSTKAENPDSLINNDIKSFVNENFGSFQSWDLDSNAKIDKTGVHMKLVSFLTHARDNKPIYVIQVGANRGEDFAKGKDNDDPVVEAVVNEKAQGLLVEAVPQNYEILVKNAAPYKKRFQCINAAVIVDKSGDKMPFYMVDSQRIVSEWPEAPYWMAKNRIGSFDKNHVVKHFSMFEAKTWEKKNPIDYYIRKVDLDVKTPKEVLQTLYREYPDSKSEEVSLLHVDAEGYDWKITKGFLDVTRPRAFVFEKIHLRKEEIESAEDYMKRNSYYFWYSGNNIYALYLNTKR